MSIRITRPLPPALAQQLYDALRNYHNATTARTQRYAAEEASRVLQLVERQANFSQTTGDVEAEV